MKKNIAISLRLSTDAHANAKSFPPLATLKHSCTVLLMHAEWHHERVPPTDVTTVHHKVGMVRSLQHPAVTCGPTKGGQSCLSLEPEHASFASLVSIVSIDNKHTSRTLSILFQDPLPP